MAGARRCRTCWFGNNLAAIAVVSSGWLQSLGMGFWWAWVVVYCDVGRCIVSWLCSQVQMCHCLKGVFLSRHMLCLARSCYTYTTYGGKVLSDHTPCCAGLPAQEEFVSVTCHIYDLLAFKGFSRWRHA